MKEPKALPPLFGVLNLAMTIVCVLYITVGFYGYLQLGDAAKGSVTLNVTSWYVLNSVLRLGMYLILHQLLCGVLKSFVIVKFKP